VRQSGPLRWSVGLIPTTAKPGRVSAVLELAHHPRDVIVSQAHPGKAHNVKDLARVVEQRARVRVWHDTGGTYSGRSSGQMRRTADDATIGRSRRYEFSEGASGAAVASRTRPSIPGGTRTPSAPLQDCPHRLIAAAQGVRVVRAQQPLAIVGGVRAAGAPRVARPAAGNHQGLGVAADALLIRLTFGLEQKVTRHRGSADRADPSPRPGRPTILPSIASARPDVAAQWHPSKNGGLSPLRTSIGTNRPVWWLCPVSPDHEWLASPGNRIWGRGTGCPFCAGKRASITNSVASLRPDLAAEWDSNVNEQASGEVVVGSNRIVAWICSTDPSHRWRAQVAKRAKRGHGCPFCSGHRVAAGTSLSMTHPAVAAEWHPTRNATLTSRDVSRGSSKRVWWQCVRDTAHEWQTAVAERGTAHATGCPFCAGRRVTPDRSLAALRPELAREWHPTRNADQRSDAVAPGSETAFWWLCPAAPDHEWKASPANRTAAPTCPFCAGRLASSTSSLAALYSHVAREWHPARNNGLGPQDVTGRSQSRAWWRCSDDPSHEWEAVIRNRAVLGNGCPYCSGFLASPTYCLLAKFPDVASYWHPIKNGELGPDDVPPMAKRSVWWQCPAGPDHEWYGPVYTATGAVATAGCPFCASRRLSVTNKLSDTFPLIAAEWHARRNGALEPRDVVHGTPRLVWWQCTVNPLHEWRTTIVARTRAGTGCPYCTLAPRSLQELLLAFELREFLPFDVEQHKVTVAQSAGRLLLDVDMLLTEQNLIIEFDGGYWHQHKVEQDTQKSDALRGNGWRVIRIRETPLYPLHDDDVQIPSVTANVKKAADVFLTHVSERLALNFDLNDYLKCNVLRAEVRARRYALKLAREKTPQPQGGMASR